MVELQLVHMQVQQELQILEVVVVVELQMVLVHLVPAELVALVL